MPPKKRKAAAAAATAVSSVPPAKKARNGNSLNIDDESPKSTPSGRPKRMTSNDTPQYNFTRTRNTTDAAGNKDESTKAGAATSALKATGEIPSRGRGRPPKDVPLEAAESISTTKGRGRGRPSKVSSTPTAGPAPTTHHHHQKRHPKEWNRCCQQQLQGHPYSTKYQSARWIYGQCSQTTIISDCLHPCKEAGQQTSPREAWQTKLKDRKQRRGWSDCGQPCCRGQSFT